MATQGTQRLLKQLGYSTVDEIIIEAYDWLTADEPAPDQIFDPHVHESHEEAAACGNCSWDTRDERNARIAGYQAAATHALALLKLAEEIRNADGILTFGLND